MDFLGEIILLPRMGDPPDNFAFFKVIDEEIPRGTLIYVTSQRHFSPVLATVIFSYVYDNELIFLVTDEKKNYPYSVNTIDHYIMEASPVAGHVLNPHLENIDEAMEDKLIRALRRDHSLSERIHQVLWDRPRFKRKMQVEQDKGTIKSIDSIGKSTGMVDIPKIPDYLLPEIHSYLGTKVDTSSLHPARVRKTMRTAPRESYLTRFRRMFGKGTRKNKKKRYGRL
jgi:hypothetical protein